MINNKTYLYIFDAKFSLKGTYNVNETVKFENCHNDTLSVLLLWAFHVALHSQVLCYSPPLDRFCWPESNISNH